MRFCRRGQKRGLAAGGTFEIFLKPRDLAPIENRRGFSFLRKAPAVEFFPAAVVRKGVSGTVFKKFSGGRRGSAVFARAGKICAAKFF